jgi:hypothetical protein
LPSVFAIRIVLAKVLDHQDSDFIGWEFLRSDPVTFACWTSSFVLSATLMCEGFAFAAVGVSWNRNSALQLTLVQCSHWQPAVVSALCNVTLTNMSGRVSINNCMMPHHNYLPSDILYLLLLPFVTCLTVCLNVCVYCGL